LYKGSRIKINSGNFESLIPSNESKGLFFIDGGQAELLVASTFVLSFIRITALGMRGTKRERIDTREFYVLVRAKGENGKISYSSEVFPLRGDVKSIIDPELLKVSSEDERIRNGVSRAPITKIVNMARRFAEIGLAKEISMQNSGSFVLLDGTLDAKYPKEEELIRILPSNVSALAKTNSLFTERGMAPAVLLSTLAPRKNDPWVYSFENRFHFVKLHVQSNHVFRFDGDKEGLRYLLVQSSDPIFLGYPYGFILVDRLARVSEKEKAKLRAEFLLREELSGMREHLASSNAHEILDRIG